MSLKGAIQRIFDRREERKRKEEVWKETFSILKEESLKGKPFPFHDAVENYVSYKEIPHSRKCDVSTEGTDIEVVESSVLDVSSELINAGYQTLAIDSSLLLDRKHEKTQESFLRTNLSIVLDRKLGFQKRKPCLFFPYGGIYVPNVWIFREGEEKDYQILDNPKEVSFFFCAPIVNPRLSKRADRQWWFVKSDEEIMKMKIRLQLQVSIHQEHDSIVVGAFGSEQANPSHHVANLYLEVIKKEFLGKIKRVTFAIQDQSKKQLFNPVGNFQPFAETVEDSSGIVIS